MKKFTILFIILLFIFANRLFAQITITNGQTAQQLAEIFAGSNITLTNSSISGDPLQYGSFNFTGTGLGVSSGIILSTGNVFSAKGPNSSNSKSKDLNGPGNSLLTKLSGFPTYDAVQLQFDFVVQTDKIEFNFVFLSEEYNEYVGTGFNDVFAFYISGPGIVGEENLAIVPGTNVPVTINTINKNSFWQFYNNNDTGITNIEYDGYTSLMTAKKDGLTPCATYTLKMILADADDGAYDSAVMFQAHSFIQSDVSATASTYSENSIALEGCIPASFTFTLANALPDDFTLPITIGGTAINGVDYKLIDKQITIPAGQTSASIIIDAINDGVPEGVETIEISFIPYPCAPPQNVRLYINDYQGIEYTTQITDATCTNKNDGLATLNITGGTKPYKLFLKETLTDEIKTYENINTSSFTANNLEAATYQISILDSYGCAADDIVLGALVDAGQTFLPDGTGAVYESPITISGFKADHTVVNVDQIIGVMASLEHSYVNDLTIWLQAPNGTKVKLKDFGFTYANSTCNFGEPVASGPIDSWNNSDSYPGIGYEYSWSPIPMFGKMKDVINSGVPTYTYNSWSPIHGNFTRTDVYLPSGSYTPTENFNAFIGSPLNGTWKIIVKDNYAKDNGYIFKWSLGLKAPKSDEFITISEPNLPVITDNNTNPNCSLTDGTLDITLTTNEYPPYTYLWNTGQTTQDITNIQSGTYILDLTDSRSCTYRYEYNISDISSIDIYEVINSESCVGTNNGSIDVTVTGGTGPYQYLWSSGELTEDITNLLPDNYVISVTDAANCKKIKSIILPPATQIKVVDNIINEKCGDNEGSINLTVSGGEGTYSYLWSNGETTKNISKLQQGQYTVTITDGNNCTIQKTFKVVNTVGNCVPACDIKITNSILTDENCGNNSGAINLTVFTSYSPYSVTWSTNETTDYISNLQANDYSVNIKDAKGCEFTQTYTIQNQTGNFNITNISTTDENCGNGLGSVNISVSGGALPYSFSWSNGSITEDLTNLHKGTYSIIATDANQCKINKTVEIINNSGTLHQTWGNSNNEICGNNAGSIDIWIQGGTIPYQYSWSNGAKTEDLKNLSSGSYICTVTDATGCAISTNEYTILNKPGTLKIDNINADNEMCDNNLGSIKLTISGGNAPYTYLWSDGTTITKNILNLTEGTYSNTITDASGCILSTGNISIINEPGTLTLDELTTVDETCSNNLGSIHTAVSGGSQPYNYLWNTGSISSGLIGIGEGNYSATVTDQNGCKINFNTTINNKQGTLAVADAIISNENCGNTDGSVNLVITGGTTPISYLWNTGQTTQNLSGINAGNYSCKITDNQGCRIDHNVQVPNNSGDLHLDNYILTNENCGNSNGSINITVSGTQTPISFLWNNGATTEDISALPTGVYSCTVTDNVSCSISIGPYSVNNYSNTLVVTNAVVTNEICNNSLGSIDITASGGSLPYNFSWSNSATTEDISNLSSGTYNYTITDATNCSIQGNYKIINTSGTLKIDNKVIKDELCNDNKGAIDVTVSGGSTPYSFNWNTGQATQNLTGLNSGLYRLTVTDNTGCQIISPNYNVADNPGSFGVTNISVHDETNNTSNGAIYVDISGEVTPVLFFWNNGTQTKNIAGLNQGIYNCVATDGKGCKINYSATIHNINGVTIDNSLIADETCGNTNGSIDISVSGGTQPYIFNWSNGAVTEDISNLDAGTYSCIITANDGTTTTFSGVVADLSANFSVLQTNVSYDNCDKIQGFVDIIVAAGVYPYTYQWSNGMTTEDLTGISAGTYDVTVTDAVGCTTQSSATLISVPGSLKIDNAAITDEVCTNGQGAIDISYSGAIAPTIISWSNGSTNEDITSLSIGKYTVNISDQMGCTTSGTYNIDNVTYGLTTSGVKVDDYCGASTGSINLTTTGGFSPYIYSWSNGKTTEDITNLPEGNYDVSITDNTNCTINYSATLTNIPGTFAINNSSITNENCGDGSGTINITYTGAAEPVSFLWNNGAITEDISNLHSSNYSVYAVDNIGCISSGNYFVDNGMSSINTFPYKQGFESKTLPDCWSYSGLNWTFQAGGQNGNPTNANSGTSNALFYNSSGVYSKLITSGFDFTGYSSMTLSFYHTQENWGSDQDELRIYYKTSSTGSWNLFATYTNNIIDWTKETIILPNLSADYYIGFEAYGNYGYGVALDDITIFETPTCPASEALTASSITSNSGILAWTPVSTATNWNIELGTQGFIPTGIGIPANTNPYQYTGLSGSTTYDFYVQDNCGVGDLSLWQGPYTFTTGCNSAPTPFSENFDTNQNIPVCWEISSGWQFVKTAIGTPIHGAAKDYTSGTGNFAVIDDSNTTSGSMYNLETGEIDISSLSNPVLYFMYQNIETGNTTTSIYSPLHIDIWDGSSWSGDVLLINTKVDKWTKFSVPLSAFSGINNLKVRFRAEGINNFYSDPSLDNVEIKEPYNYDAGIIDISSPVQDFIPNNSSPIQVKLQNFGLVALNSATINWQVTKVSNGSLIASGIYNWSSGGSPLNYNNSINVQVGTFSSVQLTEYSISATVSNPNGITDSDNSNDSFTKKIKSACSTYIAPFVQNFDSGSVLPDCWSMSSTWQFVQTAIGVPIHGAANDHNTGTGFFAVIDDSNTNAGSMYNLETPVIDISTLSTPTLYFYYQNIETGNTTVNTYSPLHIDIWNGTLWTNDVLTISNKVDKWTLFKVDLAAYSGNTAMQVRFRAEGISNINSDQSLDDIQIINRIINDASVENIVSPLDNFTPSISTPIVVNILNSGMANITTLHFDWQVNNESTGATVANGIYDWTDGGIPLIPGNSLNLQVGTFTSEQLTQYSINVNSFSPNELSDENTTNDSKTVYISSVCSKYSAPFYQNFSNPGVIPDCWTMSSGWKFVNGPIGTSIHGAASDHTTGSGYFAGIDDSNTSTGLMYNLETPEIDISALSYPTLYFWYQNLETGNTSVSIFSPLHIDVWNGTSWTSDILLINTKVDVWTKFTVDLSAFSGNTNLKVRFRAEGISNFYSDPSLDDIEINNPPMNDAGITNIVSPVTGFGSGNSIPIQVTLKNFGLSDLQNVKINWQVQKISTATIIATGTYDHISGATSFNTGNTIDVQIGTFTSAPLTDYIITVYTSLPNGMSDDNNTNNSKTISVKSSCSVYSAPFVENFDSGNTLPACWSMTSLWQFVSTAIGTPIHGAEKDHTSGTGNFAVIDDSNTSTGLMYNLETPEIDITSLTSPFLYFQYQNIETGNTTVFLFSPLHIDIWSGTSWTNDVLVINTKTDSWTPFGVDLFTFAGSSNLKVRFRAEGIANFYSDCSLDDISVQNAIPNPAAGVLSANPENICFGQTSNLSLSGYSGNISWQQSSDGITGWANVTAGTGGNTDSYTTANLSSTTYYRAKLTNEMNAVTYSNIVGVSTNTPPSSSITSPDIQICEGTSTGIQINFTGTGPWIFDYTDGTTTFNNIATNFNTTEILVYTPGLYSITKVQDAVCQGNSNTGFTNVSQIIAPTTKITSPNTEFCQGNNSNISIEFTGTAPWKFDYTNGTNNVTGITANTSPYILNVNTSGNYQVTKVVDALCTGLSMTGNTVVTVNNLPTSTITNTDIGICTGSNAEINIDFTGTAPWQFEYSDGASTFQGTANSSPYKLYVNNPGNYKIEKLSDSKCSGTNFSGNSVISLIQPAIGGTVNSDLSVICSDNKVNINLTGSSGNILWFKSSNGVIWEEIAGAISPNFTSSNLSASTYYKAQLSNACYSIFSNPLYIQVKKSATGTITASNSAVCENKNTVLTTTGYTGNIQWQEKVLKGDWTNIPGATEANYSATMFTDKYFRIVANITECVNSSVYSSDFFIKVNPLPAKASNIEGDDMVNENDAGIMYKILPINNTNSYIWTLNDTWNISGIKDNDIVYINFPKGAVSGTLSVAGSNECGIGDMTSIFINVQKSDISDLNKSGFMIFPNPSNGIFTILNPSNISEISISISDVTGKVIYNTITKNSDKTSVNLSNVASGVYFLQIEYNNVILKGKLIFD